MFKKDDSIKLQDFWVCAYDANKYYKSTWISAASAGGGGIACDSGEELRDYVFSNVCGG